MREGAKWCEGGREERERREGGCEEGRCEGGRV